MNQTQALARIRRLGGAARYAAIGAEKRVLDRLVATAQLVRLARGCYALPRTPAAIARSVLLNATLACVSALRHHGLDVPGDHTITHCAVPPTRGPSKRHLAGVRLHYGTPERADEHVPVASVLDGLVAAAFCLGYDDAVALLDTVCDRDGAPALEEVLFRIKQRSPRLAAALEIDVDTRARSRVETSIRLALRRAGLRVAAGVRIPGVGEVDLLVEGRLIVELDGFAYHNDRKAYRRDRRRDRAALRLGLVTLRFAYEDSAPEIVLESVQDSLVVLPTNGLSAHPNTPEPIADFVERVRSRGRSERLCRVGQPPRPVRRVRGHY